LKEKIIVAAKSHRGAATCGKKQNGLSSVKLAATCGMMLESESTYGNLTSAHLLAIPSVELTHA
jgi:hypothetical protein